MRNIQEFRQKCTCSTAMIKCWHDFTEMNLTDLFSR